MLDEALQYLGGVSQQQGSGGSITLSSQYGTIDVATLPVVLVNGMAPQSFTPQSAPSFTPQYSSPIPSNSPSANTAQEVDIFAKIERLADLQQKGILSWDEYTAKKSELLSRL